jgi:hypothetical protein
VQGSRSRVHAALSQEPKGGPLLRGKGGAMPQKLGGNETESITHARRGVSRWYPDLIGFPNPPGERRVSLTRQEKDYD